nr:tetratricopeptide repeat protein [Thermoanaerobaculia bacterium]
PRAQERARQRGCNSPRALGKLLVGDLDTIVLAALRPEAERRYDSASRLVEDVERFLAGQPILARKDSLGYRARKFVGRNRFIVAASAAALAALVGLSAFYTARLARERDVAEREAAKARQVSEFLAGLFHGPDPYSRQQSGELTALQLLDEGTQHLETELGDQPEVKASLLHTLAEVYRRLGRHEPAEKLIDQAVELRRVALGPDHPDTLESLQRQGVILRGLDQLDRAIPIVRQVAAGWERLYGPNDERLAMALADLALMLERNHQIPEARPLIERAIGIFERAQPVNYDRLSQAHWVLGEIFANGGDSAAGIRETRIAIQLLREKVDPDHPRLGGLLSDLAYDLDGLGHLEQAHAVYADALATVEKRLGPGNSHTDWIRMNAARVELALGEPARALAMIDQSLPGLTAAFGPNHYSVAEARLVRAGALLAVAPLAARRRR